MNAGPSIRRKLVVLTTTLPANPGDGTPEFALSLARHLAESFDVILLAPRMPGAPDELRDGALTVRRFAYFPERWEGLATGAILPSLRAEPWRIVEVPCLFIAMFAAAYRTVQRERADGIHAHWIVPAGFVASLLRTLTGVPYILTVHGTDVYGLRMKWYVWLRDRIVGRAARVLPVSDHLARTLRLRERRIYYQVIPMGTDPVEKEAGEKRDERRFLFVGRLAEQKGVDVLLKATASVDAAHLTVVGDGPEETRLRQLAQYLGLGERAEFLGRQPRQRVLALMCSAGAVVIPSRPSQHGDLEGTPVVLAEAVSTQTPIIASALGGLAERITNAETGLLTAPGSAEDLAEAMRLAIRSPERMAEMARQAQKRVSPDLDMRTTAALYTDVLAAVIEQRP